jgi:hypothetical protein
MRHRPDRPTGYEAAQSNASGRVMFRDRYACPNSVAAGLTLSDPAPRWGEAYISCQLGSVTFAELRQSSDR